jgi:hypothetical protein
MYSASLFDSAKNVHHEVFLIQYFCTIYVTYFEFHTIAFLVRLLQELLDFYAGTLISLRPIHLESSEAGKLERKKLVKT